jgi:hypothetical protein
LTSLSPSTLLLLFGVISTAGFAPQRERAVEKSAAAFDLALAFDLAFTFRCHFDRRVRASARTRSGEICCCL